MHNDLWKAMADGSIELTVHAQPGAGRVHVGGRHGSALKVRVAAPPGRGQANEALRAALAEAFGLKLSTVELVSGATSRTKRFKLTDVDRDQFEDRLDGLVAEGTTGPRPGKRNRHDGLNQR